MLSGKISGQTPVVYQRTEQSVRSESADGDVTRSITSPSDDAYDFQIDERSFSPLRPLPSIPSPLLPALQASHKLYEDRISELEDSAEEKQQRIDKLTGYLDRAMDNIEQLKKEKEKISPSTSFASIDDLIDAHDREKDEHITQLMNKISERDQAIREMTEGINLQFENLTRAADRIQQLKQELKELKSQYDAKNEELVESRKQIDKQKRVIGELKKISDLAKLKAEHQLRIQSSEKTEEPQIPEMPQKNTEHLTQVMDRFNNLMNKERKA